VSEDLRLGGLDRGDTAQLGVCPLLACNSLILVVRYFRVRARDTDRRAGLALCGVRWERGWLACDAYGAGLWLYFTDPGRHRGVACTPAGCRARSSWPACVCLNWPGRIPGCAPLARLRSHLQRLALTDRNMRAF
jgi:hypothetical protein